MGKGTTHQATMLYQPGMSITFGKGGLRVIEPAVRLSNHTERREGIADAVMVTNTLGKVQGFLRVGFCTALHLPMAHQRSPYAIEVLYA